MKIYYIRDCVSGSGSDLIMEHSDESFIRSFGLSVEHQDLPLKILCDLVGVCLGELDLNSTGYPVIKAYERAIPICTAEDALFSLGPEKDRSDRGESNG